MSADQDPLLGGEAEREAYKKNVMAIMQQTVEEMRTARRAPQQIDSTEPVMLGGVGQSGGISTAG